MMARLTEQRCFNHGGREAAARCPGCSRYFCRECVTEHEDRMLCATCFKKEADRSRAKRPPLRGIGRWIQCLVGLLIAWLFFFLLGQVLLMLPPAFHKTTLWQKE